MSFIDPDRALKRLVARLAQAAPDDVDAILTGLESPARVRVQSLLAAYHGAAPPPVDRRRPPAENRDLSPWLRDRLSGRADTEMTPAALALLQEAAAGLPVRRAGCGLWRAPHWLGRLGALASARVRQERSA